LFILVRCFIPFAAHLCKHLDRQFHHFLDLRFLAQYQLETSNFVFILFDVAIKLLLVDACFEKQRFRILDELLAQ